MRGLRTATSLIKKDLRFIFGFIYHKEFYIVLAVIAWIIAMILGAEITTLMHPELAAEWGEGLPLLFMLGYMLVTAVIVYIVQLVRRTKKKVKQENNRTLNTLKGDNHEPSADWIDQSNASM